jgi:hypothetical protein
MSETVECDVCHEQIAAGAWPWCPHGRVGPGYGDGFEPFFDIGLGKEVTGWGDIRQGMRENHLDFRDHPNAERREYAEHRRQQALKGGAR